MAILGERVPIPLEREGYSPAGRPPGEVLVHGLFGSRCGEVERAGQLGPDVLIVRPGRPRRSVQQAIVDGVTKARARIRCQRHWRRPSAPMPYTRPGKAAASIA